MLTRESLSRYLRSLKESLKGQGTEPVPTDPAELKAWLRKQLGSMIGSLNEENQALKNLDKQAGKAKEALESLQRAQRNSELPWGSYLVGEAFLAWLVHFVIWILLVVGLVGAYALLMQSSISILALLGIAGALSLG